MSRVDDDREAALRAEKALQTKRQEDVRVKEQKLSSQKFATTLEKGHQQQNTQKKQLVASQAVGRSAIEQLLEASEAVLAETDQTLQKGTYERAARQSKSQSQKGENRHQERLSHQEKSVESSQHSAHASEQVSTEGHEASLQEGLAAGHQNAEGRKADAKATREAVESKREKTEGQAATSKGFAPAQEREGSEGQSRQDGGQGQSSNDPSKNLEKFAAMQLNPALRAPVPLAQPRQVATSERLRALAAEIAQKIVERVRVGQNASGMAEFQIELRSHVLSGLEIKISGSKGKIKAVFSGHDREVLKMLKEHEESLKKALSSRGLTLAEFRVSERG